MLTAWRPPPHTTGLDMGGDIGDDDDDDGHLAIGGESGDTDDEDSTPWWKKLAKDNDVEVVEVYTIP